MKDSEFIQLRNRFLLALGITIIFIIPVSLFVYNRFSTKSELLKNILDNKNLIIYLTKDKCATCDKLKKILDENNISYFEVNTDRSDEYEEIMLRIGMSKEYVVTPGIIYVEKGKMLVNMMELDEKSLRSFLINNNLVKEA